MNTYKCPGCGNALIYDTSSESLLCDYCCMKYYPEECEIQIDELQTPINKQVTEDFREELNFYESIEMRESYMEMKIYRCSSCGAEIMVNDAEISTFCDFCGQPTIAFDRISKERMPQKIIPFLISKEEALARVKDRLTFGEYMPDEIMEANLDMIRGIYMPYWSYDCQMSFNGVLSDGNNSNSKNNSKTHVHAKHYDVSHKIHLDSSIRLNDNLAEWLNPFPENEIRDFTPSYLAGYYADRYDVSAEGRRDDVKDKLIELATIDVLKTFPLLYKSYKKDIYNNKKYKLDIYSVDELNISPAEYILMPVYFITIKNSQKPQLMLVNGATGKVVSSVIADKEKIKKKAIKNACVYSAIMALFAVVILLLAEFVSEIAWMFMLYLILAPLASCIMGQIAKKKYYHTVNSLMSRSMMSVLRDRGER